MIKMGLIFCAACFLASCATMYKPEGFMGGYSDIQLADNIFRVSFRGNGYTSEERAAEFCLLRSAEVAFENGFKYFVVVESGQSSKLSTYTTPTTTNTTGTGTISGNTIYGSATTTTYGGQTYIISKPRSTNTILCFKDKPDIQSPVFTAEYVSNAIRKKYNIMTDIKSQRIFSHEEELQVTKSDAVLRSWPGGGQVIMNLPLGACLQYEGQYGEWFKVKIYSKETGKTAIGYVHSSFVEILK